VLNNKPFSKNESGTTHLGDAVFLSLMSLEAIKVREVESKIGNRESFISHKCIRYSRASCREMQVKSSLKSSIANRVGKKKGQKGSTGIGEGIVRLEGLTEGRRSFQSLEGAEGVRIFVRCLPRGSGEKTGDARVRDRGLKYGLRTGRAMASRCRERMAKNTALNSNGREGGRDVPAKTEPRKVNLRSVEVHSSVVASRGPPLNGLGVPWDLGSATDLSSENPGTMGCERSRKSVLINRRR